MKKRLCLILICFMVALTFGCSKNSSGPEGSLKSIMNKIYEGIPGDDIQELERIKVNKENEEYYLGKITFEYEEALASEPMMTSVAHSVVLIRVKDEMTASKAKEELKETVDPRKWVCVGVDNVITESKGNLVLLVMDDEIGTKIRDNFLEL